MVLKDRKHWVFDLDGTLTQPVHDFVHIRSELGIAPEEDILSTIAQFKGEHKRTMMARLDELERHYAALAKPAGGVLELLEALANQDVKFGILTRNIKALAESSLNAIGAGEYFSSHYIFGRDEALPKPDPQGINLLIDQWDTVNSSTVMVGDYYFDMAAGKAADVMTVHVDASDRHWPEITDVRVENLSELALMVKN